MKRIIEKETKLFIRDDFDFDEETEIGLDVEQAQGFYLPRWNGTEWVEGGVAPEPVEPEPQAPSEAERIEMLENMLLLLMME